MFRIRKCFFFSLSNFSELMNFFFLQLVDNCRFKIWKIYTSKIYAFSDTPTPLERLFRETFEKPTSFIYERVKCKDVSSFKTL